jgi:hypothetical protein
MESTEQVDSSTDSNYISTPLQTPRTVYHQLYKVTFPYRKLGAVLYTHFQLSPFGFKCKMSSLRRKDGRVGSGAEWHPMNVVCVVVYQMEYHDVRIKVRKDLWLILEWDLQSCGSISKEETVDLVSAWKHLHFGAKIHNWNKN